MSDLPSLESFKTFFPSFKVKDCIKNIHLGYFLLLLNRYFSAIISRWGPRNETAATDSILNDLNIDFKFGVHKILWFSTESLKIEWLSVIQRVELNFGAAIHISLFSM
ncbi:hypothetical protein QE382_002850 [Sphingobacterium zeae]|uniref:Uncharacterized protein n=1 Tax=Sphingobacterium zeae TaxID=1776859 RepID=A0ABU0U8Z5_9SPHI|nr:hypothetical protein [Sphingobacterium zeae]